MATNAQSLLATCWQVDGCVQCKPYVSYNNGVSTYLLISPELPRLPSGVRMFRKMWH